MRRWFDPQQWECRALVSDGATALVKLGLSGLGCPSLPDVFHLLYDLSKSMGSALARQRMQLQKQLQALQAKRETASSSIKISELNTQIMTVQAQQQRLETDQQEYQHSKHALCEAIHPFDGTTGESQLGWELPARLQGILSHFEQLSQTYAPQASQAAVGRWQRHIPSLALTLDAWWQWVLQALRCQTQDPDTQNWVLSTLLPWVYWHQQTQKTRNPHLKLDYEQATQKAHACFQADAFTQTLSSSQQQQWIDWAIWMCAKFQRTSAAVEGRNGYLSRLHQANRGFTAPTLKVLTVIHNFDLKRHDGSTAAQRLFGKPFPDLFEWVFLHMGELPTPRKTRKARISKKPTVHPVPA